VTRIGDKDRWRGSVARAGREDRWRGLVARAGREDRLASWREKIYDIGGDDSSQAKSSAVVTSGDASVNDSSSLHVYVSVRHWYRYTEYLFL
jgi:hypothetical protein